MKCVNVFGSGLDITCAEVNEKTCRRIPAGFLWGSRRGALALGHLRKPRKLFGRREADPSSVPQIFLSVLQTLCCRPPVEADVQALLWQALPIQPGLVWGDVPAWVPGVWLTDWLFLSLCRRQKS